MWIRILALATLVFALVGCDEVIVENTETPTEASVLILIGGQCRTAEGRIECEDSSAPAERLTAVRWELRSSTTGISQDRKQIDPGAEVSFSGLAPDTYEVEQTVAAEDGSTAQQVHGDLVISQ